MSYRNALCVGVAAFLVAPALMSRPAFAGGTEFTDGAAYSAAATSAGAMTFTNGNSYGLDSSPYYSEGNVHLHSYYRANGSLYDFGYLYSSYTFSSTFDGTDLYQGYAGANYGGITDGAGWLEFTFAPGQKYTAAGLEMASQYAAYDPTYAFSAHISYYDGGNLVFTTGTYTFPGLFGGSPTYLFLGATTDAPFDRVVVNATPNVAADYILADNFRFGTAITPAAPSVPEPGAIPFGLSALGMAGVLVVSQRLRRALRRTASK